MTNYISFKNLSDDTLDKIVSFGTTSKTVITYFNSCVKELDLLMNRNDIVFCKSLALDWLDTLKLSKHTSYTNGSTYLKYRNYRRTILLLSDNYDGNLNEQKTYPSTMAKYPTTISYVSLLDNYRSYLIPYDYANETITFKINCAKYMLIYLESISISDIKDCNHETLSNYFLTDHFRDRKPSGIKAEITRLIHFIIFLEDCDYIDYKNLHYAPPTITVQEKRIVTVLDSNAEMALLEDYSISPSNLRDRAAYFLALHCGLRTCDIVNLKFNNIEWENQILNIVQQKTKVPLSIPMDNETSNAIIEYLINERRDCDLEYIFITSIGSRKKLSDRPFKPFNRISSVSLKRKPAEFGLQIMRRTFASKLLKSGTPLSVISSSLGHESKEVVNKYLSTDNEKMKLCALDIDNFSYKGGLFK